MKRTAGIFWGCLLIGGGVLLMMQNLGYLGDASPYLWALLFGVFGLSFFAGFALDRSRWWALIPGAILLGLGATVFLSLTSPERAEPWIGSVFLGSVALAFWLVYLVRREMWWALIPAGVLTTLAVVAGLGDSAGGFNSGAIFFFGLALTFSLVAIGAGARWPLIPAAALFALALFLLVGFGQLAEYIWPVALIIVGAFLLFRVWKPAR